MTQIALPVVQRHERLADQMARSLETLIADGALIPGEKLPPERVLCEQFGVSRTTAREAVRSLAAKGLVDVRSGGGTWVRQPSSQPAGQLLGMAMRSAGGDITWANVLEAREILEVKIAGLAAQRRTPADLEALRAVIEALRALRGRTDVTEEATRADVRFHDTLAAATHNPAMQLLLGAMQDALRDARRLAYRLKRTLEDGIEQHTAILAQVERGDTAGAERTMLTHIRLGAETLTNAQGLSGAPPGRSEVHNV